MKANLRFRVKIYGKDGMSRNLFPTRRAKLSHNPVLDNFEKAYLKVTYGPGVHNDGTFYEKSELLLALAAWNEKQLISFYEEGEWDE